MKLDKFLCFSLEAGGLKFELKIYLFLSKFFSRFDYRLANSYFLRIDCNFGCRWIDLLFCHELSEFGKNCT